MAFSVCLRKEVLASLPVPAGDDKVGPRNRHVSIYRINGVAYVKMDCLLLCNVTTIVVQMNS